MRPTLVHSGCGEPLKGVHRSRIHRMSSKVVQKRCVESLSGAQPSRIHLMRSTLGHRVAVNICRLYTLQGFTA